MDYYKYYLPTCHLRFVERETVQLDDWRVITINVLQQKWKSAIAGQDDVWRDVELADEFD